MPVNVIHYGLGPIGARILDLALKADGLDVRGAVDIDPQKVGQDVGTLLDGAATGMRVVATVADLPSRVMEQGVAAVHATGSYLEKVWPQLRDLLDAGCSIVSTSEELSFPWHRYPELSADIDEYARSRGLTVLGAGVNPGFVMDALAVCLTVTMADVHHVRVTRCVDVSQRRVPLQRKVGVGTDRATFARLGETGEIGHVGLEESARLVAHALGWVPADVVNTIQPTVATAAHQVAIGELNPGDVDGLTQTCKVRTADERGVELELTMRVETEQRDEITISGDDHRRLLLPGGMPGDHATAAIAVNYAKRVDALPSGLLTMAEAGMPRYS